MTHKTMTETVINNLIESEEQRRQELLGEYQFARGEADRNLLAARICEIAIGIKNMKSILATLKD